MRRVRTNDGLKAYLVPYSVPTRGPRLVLLFTQGLFWLSVEWGEVTSLGNSGARPLPGAFPLADSPVETVADAESSEKPMASLGSSSRCSKEYVRPVGQQGFEVRSASPLEVQSLRTTKYTLPFSANYKHCWATVRKVETMRARQRSECASSGLDSSPSSG